MVTARADRKKTFEIFWGYIDTYLYRCNLAKMSLSRSFIKIENKIGAKMEPWDTPSVISRKSDL